MMIVGFYACLPAGSQWIKENPNTAQALF